MPLGPGKYDDMCTMVREATGAQAVVVVIVGGSRGDGFSVQAEQCEDPQANKTMWAVLAGSLISVARQIVEDLKLDLKLKE